MATCSDDRRLLRCGRHLWKQSETGNAWGATVSTRSCDSFKDRSVIWPTRGARDPEGAVGFELRGSDLLRHAAEAAEPSERRRVALLRELVVAVIAAAVVVRVGRRGEGALHVERERDDLSRGEESRGGLSFIPDSNAPASCASRARMAPTFPTVVNVSFRRRSAAVTAVAAASSPPAPPSATPAARATHG